MSDGLGAKLDFALVKAATWATAATVGALNGVYVDAVSPIALQQEVIPDETLGTDFQSRVDLGNKVIDLTVDMPLRYENHHWAAIAGWFGDDSQTGTSSPYTHIMDLQDETSLYFTAAARIDDMIVEYPSVTISGFTLATGGDGFMTLQLKGIANTVKYAADATNAAANYNAITFKTTTLKVPLQHGRVNINAQGGADFNSSGEGSDRVYPSEITIEGNRDLDRDFTANRTTSNSVVWQTTEPARNGYPSVIVTLAFPELTALSDLEAFQDETMKKMEIYFYASANDSIKFQFPNLQPIQPTFDLAGAGRQGYTVSYMALSCATAPTGMTGVTAPVRLTLINTSSAAYDA
jgi:hypothetical protein